MNNLTGELIKCSGYKDFEKKYLERLEEKTNLRTFKKESIKAIRASKQGGNVSAELLFGKYSIGNLPKIDELKSLKNAEVIIERKSLDRIIKKHGKEFSEKEWLMIENIIKKPDIIADNSTHHNGSFLLYKYIARNNKSCMECAIAKHTGEQNHGYVIHYQKMKLRKLKKLKKNNRILYGLDKMSDN